MLPDLTRLNRRILQNKHNIPLELVETLQNLLENQSNQGRPPRWLKCMTDSRLLGQSSRLPPLDGTDLGANYVAAPTFKLIVSEMSCIPYNHVFIFYNFASQEVVYVLHHQRWRT